MKTKNALNYRNAGVLSNAELGLDALLRWVRPTEEFRRGKPTGRSLMDVGFFASVVDLGNGLGLAMCTDGVGTKVLIAEMLDQYDTIGIDCIAMNVNDLICVGAEPMSMVDYIAIENANPTVLEAVGRGLHEGARQAGVNIVGGEIAQIAQMIRGERPGKGLDIAAMCVGLVSTDRILIGQDVTPGDVILGLRSSGIHSNGLTLARKALCDEAKLDLHSHHPAVGRKLGEELLEPTHIYVPEILELLRSGARVKALINITSDGFLNLTRIAPNGGPVGFLLDHLPKPQPIFDLIQEAGHVSDAEMHRVFNMGIGFCIIAPNEQEVLRAIRATVERHGVDIQQIGSVVSDKDGRVFIPSKHLVGRDDEFVVSNDRP